MINKLIISSLALVCALTGTAQSTKMLSADKSSDPGLIYSLPETELTLDLTARFMQRVAGPFREYAPRYLGDIDVIASDSYTCTLTDVKLYTSAHAGTEQYIMTLKPGATTSICVADDGMLLAINTQAEAPTIPTLTAGDRPESPRMDEYLQYVGEDFLSSLSEAKKAAMLARAIMEIRESRLSLSRGTAETMPVDGRQLELMLQSLKTQEDALMRAFVGYEYSYTESRRVTLTPDSAMLGGARQVIARLSPSERFSHGDDLVGEPVYITLTNLLTPQLPENEKGEPKAMPKGGVAYRIPATATVAVSYMGRNFLSRQIELAQGGVVYGLDPKLFTDKKAPSYALFNPVTGALVQIALMQTLAQ